MELLGTPRLLLRAWEPDDLDAFYDLYSRWDVMRWLGPHPRRVVTDLDEARTRLDRWRTVQSAPLGLWAIVPTGASAPVGTVLLLPLADANGPTDEVEVGWHLHPDHWGRGLVTEAAGALLGLAALPRVLALTDPDNERSQAVAGRLGMADEGLTDRWFGTTTRQFAL
ncbi:GNAT family N-acetyltransferase [Jidongwangia harbinensis]|uniref:GNAT family N-acetyltransferase n=1 Tax=Jidongwangia harbinensis TaxID=2878561 RepID=UPI001CD91E70|nr:GNAT family N-acetyltransferase [Jidongwangia harbinensis]MCA2212235.1 GNAT family N-acetyltransferase [Jidongwangia harbinensis]